MGCPQNIVIGENGLDCYGSLKDKRYGNVDSQFYDGIHLSGELGKAHYSGAVLKTFKLAFPHLQKIPNHSSNQHRQYTHEQNMHQNEQYASQNERYARQNKHTSPNEQYSRQNRQYTRHDNSNSKNVINPWSVDTALPLYNRFAALVQSGN